MTTTRQQEEWLPDEELTPCINCEKPFDTPILHIIEINLAGVDVRAVQQRQGMTMMLGGHADLARVMGAYPDGVVRVNTDPEAKVKMLICSHCICEDLNLQVLKEKAYKWCEERKAALAANR